MNTIILNRRQARDLDRQAIEDFGMPGIALMENAGRSIADFIIQQHVTGKIVICCGKGNNGGDGFVVARHLDNHDLDVQVLLFAKPEEIKGDAKINYDIAYKSKISILMINETNFEEVKKDILSTASWIVDALFGTGLEGEIKNPFDKIIEAINNTKATILAVDIPSGLDCDTGKPLGIAITAKHTFTFACQKLGFTKDEAKKYIGDVHIVDIGIPKLLIINAAMN